MRHLTYYLIKTLGFPAGQTSTGVDEVVYCYVGKRLKLAGWSENIGTGVGPMPTAKDPVIDPNRDRIRRPDVRSSVRC